MGDRKEYMKLYRKINKEKRNAQSRKYKEEHLQEIKEYSQKYRKKHKEYFNKYNIEYRRNHPNIQKNSDLQRFHNITLEQYNDIFKKQNGKCVICKIHQSQLKKSLAVDHNHHTGKIRGLLCMNCNTALGLLKESLEIIENMKIYLS